MGFEWIDCHDAEHSVLAWLRWGRDGSFVVVAANFTPQPQHDYRLGVPVAGEYVEVLNTDSAFYGGSNLGNGGILTAVEGEGCAGRRISSSPCRRWGVVVLHRAPG